MKKLIVYFFAAMILFGIGAFVCVKLQKQPEKPQYTQSDSIQNVKIDSVIGVYQQVIDSLAKKKPQIEYKISTIRSRDTIIYNGNDTICYSIIARKDSLICELDSLNSVLDAEAQSYSDMLIFADEKRLLEKKMYEKYIFCKDSTAKAVQDSLISELKLKKRSLFWQKIKTGFAVIAGTTAVIYTNVK